MITNNLRSTNVFCSLRVKYKYVKRERVIPSEVLAYAKKELASASASQSSNSAGGASQGAASSQASTATAASSESKQVLKRSDLLAGAELACAGKLKLSQEKLSDLLWSFGARLEPDVTSNTLALITTKGKALAVLLVYFSIVY